MACRLYLGNLVELSDFLGFFSILVLEWSVNQFEVQQKILTILKALHFFSPAFLYHLVISDISIWTSSIYLLLALLNQSTMLLEELPEVLSTSFLTAINVA